MTRTSCDPSNGSREASRPVLVGSEMALLPAKRNYEVIRPNPMEV